MEESKPQAQQDNSVKPVCEYLVNGPMPASDLMYMSFLRNYLDMGLIDTILDIHFMLQSICENGSPRWWKGSVAEFEQEFDTIYQQMFQDVTKYDDIVWQAAQHEVEEGNIAPLPEDETDDEREKYLTQGMKRLHQIWAVELLMNMWVNAAGV